MLSSYKLQYTFSVKCLATLFVLFGLFLLKTEVYKVFSALKIKGWRELLNSDYCGHAQCAFVISVKIKTNTRVHTYSAGRRLTGAVSLFTRLLGIASVLAIFIANLTLHFRNSQQSQRR